jgi:transposase
MSAKRYPEEFKIEAVKQILEHGHSVADVSRRLGVSTHSLNQWIRLQQIPAAHQLTQASQSEELRRIKAELKRVTEERDILKKAAAYFARQCD